MILRAKSEMTIKTMKMMMKMMEKETMKMTTKKTKKSLKKTSIRSLMTSPTYPGTSSAK